LCKRNVFVYDWGDIHIGLRFVSCRLLFDRHKLFMHALCTWQTSGFIKRLRLFGLRRRKLHLSFRVGVLFGLRSGDLFPTWLGPVHELLVGVLSSSGRVVDVLDLPVGLLRCAGRVHRVRRLFRGSVSKRRRRVELRFMPRRIFFKSRLQRLHGVRGWDALRRRVARLRCLRRWVLCRRRVGRVLRLRRGHVLFGAVERMHRLQRGQSSTRFGLGHLFGLRRGALLWAVRCLVHAVRAWHNRSGLILRLVLKLHGGTFRRGRGVQLVHALCCRDVLPSSS
jgi:hypothetical protein